MLSNGRDLHPLSCNPKTDFKGFRKFLAPLRYQINDLAEQRFDLIYSAGLYDYLRDGGAKKLTKNLFGLLNPAGTLIIGNFSPANPPDLRFPMEYLYDWVLIYRDESEMYGLADSIPESEIAHITLIQEPLGINYFLKIEKRG